MTFRSILFVSFAIIGALHDSRPAAAQASLGPVLKAANATVATGRAPRRVASFADSSATLVARVHPVADGETMYHMIFQADDDIRTPIATLGDSLYFTDLSTKKVTAARVTDLKPVKQNCQGGWDRSGWAYAVDRPIAPLIPEETQHEESHHPSGLAVYGRRVTFRPQGDIPPVVLQKLQAAHLAELTRYTEEYIRDSSEMLESYEGGAPAVREALMGDATNQKLDASEVRSMRIGGRTVYVLGFDGIDPINAEAIDSPYSLTFDEAGNQLGKFDLNARWSIVVEMTGDDADELHDTNINAAATLRNGKWIVSSPDESNFPPCY